MENGRCSCGLLRAYPLPCEFPRPGGGRVEWVGAGSPPLLHTRCGAEPGIPAHVWASPFTNPLPNHEPSAGRLSPEGGSALLRAGVGGTWPGSRELGCRDVGSALQGCASHVLLLNFALSWTLPLPASFSIPLLLLPVTFRLFRVQCSVWLSSHQAILGGTDEKRGSEGSSGGHQTLCDLASLPNLSDSPFHPLYTGQPHRSYYHGYTISHPFDRSKDRGPEKGRDLLTVTQPVNNWELRPLGV